MSRLRKVVLVLIAAAALSGVLTVSDGSLSALTAEPPLPARLTDREFWTMVTESSEPSGTFHSENLVSNEARFQTIIPTLLQTAVPGRAYVGVGSEQNFTYIVAMKPTVAFIVDLRRGNLDLHLAYKAIFEMSADRVDFVSRLFSRARPAGLTATSTPEAIFAAFEKAAPSEALFDQNLKAIESTLTTKHGFTLSDGDRDGLKFVYQSWFDGGPDLRYQLTTQGDRGRNPAPGFSGRAGTARGARGGGPQGDMMPTYADLMTANDGAGHNRSYLADDATFRWMKDLEARNLLVPVVGNFAGPKALRAVGAYLRQHDQIVSTFYVSNVEQYLRQDGIWDAFCANAATLPIDARSVFVRSDRGATAFFDLAVAPIAAGVKACAR